MDNISSERSMLFNRANKIHLAQRIKHGIKGILDKQDKLSQSRVSNRSASSRKSRSSRMARSMDLTPVSPKIKLLQNITQKLKSPKYSAFTPQPKMTQSQTIPSLPHQLSPEKVKEHTQDVQTQPIKKNHRLQSLLRDVKKCNQMSTKAVNSMKTSQQKQIWKNAAIQVQPQPQVEAPKAPSRLIKSQTAQLPDPSNKKLSGMFKQLLGMKQQLRTVKEQNKLLAELIKNNESKTNSQEKRPCVLCGCTCNKNKANQYQQVRMNNNPSFI